MKDRKGKHHGGMHKERREGNYAGKAPSFKEFMKEPPQADIKDITRESKGQSFMIQGVVDRVVQTGGPTIFYVSDGTSILALKAFEGAGVRSYPHVDVGDAIRASINVEEYNDELEGEVVKIHKLTEEERKAFVKRVEEIERKRAEVQEIPFLVKSPTLDKLKERFIKAATEIRLAVFQNRPIIIRHHNDTDGYSSGFALERAILPLVSKQHNSIKSSWEFYTRAPCNAPMYEIDDSIRDTAHSLANEAKFSNKMPLVVIADTGSGEEDLLGIQQGKVHGIDFIVIDHHQFDKDVISAETLVHINPFLVGEDGAKFSAGMLCVELARFINPEVNINEIPAMAGMADMINNPEVMDAYIAHAAKKGYSKELLMEISRVIDFVSAKLRFMEAREYIEVLFGEPMEKQKKLVNLMAPYIRNLEEKGLKIAESAVKVEKIKDISLQILEVEKTFPRGFYPKPGRCTSFVQSSAEKKTKKVITLGVLSDAITMRANDAANFSVPELIKYLDKKVPDAFVEGGGHKNAGAIKFIPSKQTEVLNGVRSFIKERN